ncbi:uncharacterized protein LTR77_006938 [Saxophila tyrrhenica]|uniref:tripeptidyl-peptidase II n=1 Tax=Saxophila tyrrhenica TaxID=1690608 RepID=A0AAV9PA21_9PEZI|nr:hypothetical protein LTR77_006938 [Saxophila tyrrhenica]
MARITLWATLGLAAVSAVIALPAPPSHAVHEERSAPPARWLKKDRVPPSAKLLVRLGLTQSNLDIGPEYLLDVSHPESPNYGKHWTADQVIDAFKPSQDTVDTVRSWLVDSGIKNHTITHTKNQAWLAFHASAKQLESLLHTEYFEYHDQHTGAVSPSTDCYHLPQHIREHVDYITPGITLLPPMHKPGQRQQSTSTQLDRQRKKYYVQGSKRSTSRRSPYHDEQGSTDSCDQSITPACVAALYEIPQARLADPSNSMGILQLGDDRWDQFDLDLYFDEFAHWIPKGTHPRNGEINGAVSYTEDPANVGVEAMTDLAAAYPIVYPQNITFWSVDDEYHWAHFFDPNTWFPGRQEGTMYIGMNNFLDAIDGSFCTSCAYGECGNLDGYDPSYPDLNPGGYRGELQCGQFKPTNVISISYGLAEFQVPVSLARRQCAEYMKLGLQGISFVVASGDDGVGRWDPNAKHQTSQEGEDTVFAPDVMNTCPWVTSVGATQVSPGRTVSEAETAAQIDGQGFSGGGFSNLYPRPAYQRAAVDAFFAEHEPDIPSYSGIVPNSTELKALPDIGTIVGDKAAADIELPDGSHVTGGQIARKYNRIGRGYPDVAANGANVPNILNGEVIPTWGTSFSAPVFAAIITRINEERIAVGKSALGFLNPTLYAHPEMMNDITEGSNKGSGSLGFTAGSGWDPVTGLGTPSYPKMLKLFLSLP